MRIPTIRGVIDRRILANFRVDPAALSAVLPPPFRPQLVDGFGIAGICLIRLKHVRPRLLPAAIGISSENAAHRVAVQWDSGGQCRTGVYIPRRDTSSRLNVLAGGRLFPGTHHHARFDVQESGDQYRVAMHSHDGSAHLRVNAHVAKELPNDSVFPTQAAASEFFEAGSLGYSPSSKDQLDGLELRAFNWQVQPLAVEEVESSYFADPNRFPPGAATFDCALLMRGIHHEWHSREVLCCTATE